jgi:quercetin dioxygenase-like cupin family protein
MDLRYDLGWDYLKRFTMVENFKQKLKSEGFVHVYEWTDSPNTIYPEHSHKGRVSFYIVKGSITMNIDGIEHAIYEGGRIDVPINAPHTATVGPYGCTFVVGEDIKGDS